MKCSRSFPNPFHSKTHIEYTLPMKSKIGLQIYNATGDLVYRLMTHVQTSGRKSILWDGRNFQGQKMPEGDYYYVINVDNAYELSNRMTLKGIK